MMYQIYTEDPAQRNRPICYWYGKINVISGLLPELKPITLIPARVFLSKRLQYLLLVGIVFEREANGIHILDH
ncbi:hypothetical protein DCC81_02670 [Chitinophaga parva]|uniref:Uncharacterized protein n=1 Tax=Chitinophaga parva TaxID=2169414 RepID=A0A2T7BL52_9BACT|nr:hypothetical protein DCC81_02670 [Chitinophaga parva]